MADLKVAPQISIKDTKVDWLKTATVVIQAVPLAV